MSRKGPRLDVNLLVALFDADHAHHELADWSTCRRAGDGHLPAD